MNLSQTFDQMNSKNNNKFEQNNLPKFTRLLFELHFRRMNSIFYKY